MEHVITWYGHSTFKIETNGKTLFIDPFFDGNPSSPVASETIEKADLVLVTHDHGDHVGQALEICAKTKASLVGVFDTVSVMFDEGLPPEQGIGMNIGGTVEQLGIKIKMVQAMHSTASGVAAGYILTFEDGYCLYHAGDTGLFSSMELFGKFHAIDLALLPIGGWFTMDPKQAAYACKLLKPRKVAPMHWGTFPILEQNTKSFDELLIDMAPDTRLLTLEIGTPVTLTKDPFPSGCGCD